MATSAYTRFPNTNRFLAHKQKILRKEEELKNIQRVPMQIEYPYGLCPYLENYSYNVSETLGFLNNTDSYDPRPYCGIELEFSVAHRRFASFIETAKQLYYTVEGYGMLKTDGSVAGIELVTAPAKPSVHLKRLNNVFNLDCFKTGYISETLSTGLHIHVDKSGLSKVHVAKLNLFINARNNHTLINKIARRNCNANSYATYANFPTNISITPTRYRALNLCNTHTVEFRMFKSVDSLEKVQTALEFVYSALEFTKVFNYNTLSTSNYIKFLANRPEYSLVNTAVTTDA